HDEMLRKVNEKTAINEARMQMALESVDHQALQIEEDAEKLQAQELVKQFKLEMGLASPAPVSESGEAPERTIGKKMEVQARHAPGDGEAAQDRAVPVRRAAPRGGGLGAGQPAGAARSRHCPSLPGAAEEGHPLSRRLSGGCHRPRRRHRLGSPPSHPH